MRYFVMAMILLLMLGARAQSLADRLQKLPASVGDNDIVTLQPGESWVSLGIREHVGYEHLARANPGTFPKARRLLVPGRHQVPALVTDGLVINLPELMDYRLQGGQVVTGYPISIGRITSRWHTPIGRLKVVTREKNPVWHRPDWAGGGTMPPGPRNPLGNRWIGLNRPGYGLHGTNDPTSIGRMVSHGCIRHFPPHILELFNAVKVGTPVVITYETLTVGQQDNIVYLSVFPDVYARGTNSPSAARARLKEFNLEEVLTPRMLERALALTDGVARPILGSYTAVRVNLLPAGITVGPTMREGATYLPLRELAKALGATVTRDQATVATTVTRQDKSVAFGAAGGRTFTALGTTFVAVRPLVEGLGGSISYTNSVMNIRI